MSGRVFICTTCNRYAQAAGGGTTPGQRLAQAMKACAARAGSAVAIRTVECLNGCPRPCTAALREPGKTVIRFSGLTPEDAPALLDAAARYATCADGNLPPDALPEALRIKLSGRVTLTSA
jgi:predicted metal-binding protein